MEKPIRINRTVAVLLVIANAIYLVIGIARFFQPAYKPGVGGFKAAHVNNAVYYGAFNLGVAFFSIILLVGLFWLLLTFKEKKWILSGLIVNFACKILVVVFTVAVLLLKNIMEWNMAEAVHSMMFVLQMGIFYMAFTCFFVKHEMIRSGFIVFGILTILIHLIGYLPKGVPLDWYFKYGTKLIIVPFVPTMALYIKVLRAAGKHNDADLIPLYSNSSAGVGE